MANISEENGRREVWFTLQGHFASRSTPFRRPLDLTHFVPFDCLPAAVAQDRHGVVGEP
jgi:hypothetical protein